MFIYPFLNMLFCFLDIQTMGACCRIYDVAIVFFFGIIDVCVACLTSYAYIQTRSCFWKMTGEP
jgi:hypothetical protein